MSSSTEIQPELKAICTRWQVHWAFPIITVLSFLAEASTQRWAYYAPLSFA
ncbi:hypothetical protein ACS8YF_18265 [Salinisphaera sp. SWV1]|uniref:hypothetical protein n=1 Tax=Salinisphaera sp. SWV1 TaxID=3454139 RepID=UPI003F843F95